MILFETQRLVVRTAESTDAPFMRELLTDPGWIAQIGHRNIQSDVEAWAYIERVNTMPGSERGFGIYFAIDKDRSVPVGVCTILKRASLDEPDIGYAFVQAESGKGYATEAGAALRQYAHENLGLVRVLAIAKQGNAASIRVLHKIGMTDEGLRSFENAADKSAVFSSTISTP